LAKKIRLELTCTCHRGRGGVIQGEPQQYEKHACPTLAIAEGKYIEKFCDCCPSCTATCLPLKAVRDKESIEKKHGNIITRLFERCKITYYD
jgi:hypothetical protein